MSKLANPEIALKKSSSQLNKSKALLDVRYQQLSLSKLNIIRATREASR
jgi:hypothetical protein